MSGVSSFMALAEIQDPPASKIHNESSPIGGNLHWEEAMDRRRLPGSYSAFWTNSHLYFVQSGPTYIRFIPLHTSSRSTQCSLRGPSFCTYTWAEDHT